MRRALEVRRERAERLVRAREIADPRRRMRMQQLHKPRQRGVQRLRGEDLAHWHSELRQRYRRLDRHRLKSDHFFVRRLSRALYPRRLIEFAEQKARGGRARAQRNALQRCDCTAHVPPSPAARPPRPSEMALGDAQLDVALRVRALGRQRAPARIARRLRTRALQGLTVECDRAPVLALADERVGIVHARVHARRQELAQEAGRVVHTLLDQLGHPHIELR
mmetsp:Transcript_14867/g.37643  ORF Transcript_14867/g.37643 Transcript_14867/m.37643 type:complete len:222 (-) Transcript_14867:109-774(-)